jgi:predicted RNase H-related nuclease YkuK (DUF458 family)
MTSTSGEFTFSTASNIHRFNFISPVGSSLSRGYVFSDPVGVSLYNCKLTIGKFRTSNASLYITTGSPRLFYCNITSVNTNISPLHFSEGGGAIYLYKCNIYTSVASAWILRINTITWVRLVECTIYDVVMPSSGFIETGTNTGPPGWFFENCDFISNNGHSIDFTNPQNTIGINNCSFTCRKLTMYNNRWGAHIKKFIQNFTSSDYAISIGNGSYVTIDNATFMSNNGVSAIGFMGSSGRSGTSNLYCHQNQISW